MSMPILQAKNVWKEYGDVCVLERLNVSVQAGEFITLVGASGCGKTTFLKLLLGTEGPSRGELLLDGQAIPREPDARITSYNVCYTKLLRVSVVSYRCMPTSVKRSRKCVPVTSPPPSA